MRIQGSVALVTGASRGIGRAFATELLARGARVYATARNPRDVDLPGAEVLKLDITDPAAITAAAETAPDVTLLVNNAGISHFQGLVGGDLDRVRAELDTHLWGTLGMIRAFAPVLARNGGGAVLNTLSSLSWMSFAGATSYSVAKAAQWALTNGVRLELASQGTLVTALHVGAVDTDMMAAFDIPKLSPAEVVAAALDGVEAGALEVLADDAARQAKAAAAADPAVVYPQTVPVVR